MFNLAFSKIWQGFTLKIWNDVDLAGVIARIDVISWINYPRCMELSFGVPLKVPYAD
jgi:hypothetical protein